MNDKGDYVEMHLTNNGIIKFDKEDFHKVDKYLWYATQTNGGIYARRNHEDGDNEKYFDARARYALHNELMDFLPEKDDNAITIDHINRDTLDNRKQNLRMATKIVQCQNRETKTGQTGEKFILLLKKKAPNTEFYEVKMTVGKNKKGNPVRRRISFSWSQHGGADSAFKKAKDARDKILEILKYDDESKQKLIDRDITFTEMLEKYNEK